MHKPETYDAGSDFAEEARQTWRNVGVMLEKAGASISDIVSVRQYFTPEPVA